jgi:hypothetical protein
VWPLPRCEACHKVRGMTNDRVLLDAILAERHLQFAPQLPLAEFFELFAAQQTLHAFDLSWEELTSGLVGGGGDGGIDGFFAFVDGILLAPGEPAPTQTHAPHFELVVIQAKLATGFSEVPLDRLTASLPRLLDFDSDLDDLATEFNQDLLALVDSFRRAYVARAARFPSVTSKVFYVTRGAEVHPNVARKADQLRGMLRTLFSDSEASVDFVTPRDLVDRARRDRPTALELRLLETIATSDGAYVGLVSIPDYFAFVTNDDGALRETLFESNVRDYEGSKGVNASIRGSLDIPTGDDFWWLNNGVTVVAARAAARAKTLTLEYPQIVNGLQTTREIFEFMQDARPADETRAVLVRVVVPPTDASRDRIIRATNSQSTIPGVALYATDPIQRDIEDFFARQGLFYERRRNRYRNEGKPLARIVTIPYLAEAVLALALREPHLGQPREGGRFLRNEKLYQEIFAPDRPLEEYLNSVQTVRGVDGYLTDKAAALGRRRHSVTRYLLPVSMGVALEQLKGARLTELHPERIVDGQIEAWLKVASDADGGFPWDTINLDPMDRRRGGKKTRRSAAAAEARVTKAILDHLGAATLG